MRPGPCMCIISFKAQNVPVLSVHGDAEQLTGKKWWERVTPGSSRQPSQAGAIRVPRTALEETTPEQLTRVSKATRLVHGRAGMQIPGCLRQKADLLLMTTGSIWWPKAWASCQQWGLEHTSCVLSGQLLKSSVPQFLTCTIKTTQHLHHTDTMRFKWAAMQKA